MCAINPRLLRPTTTGFDPRRITGLQGWWDAADLSSMAQNSDGTTAVTSTNDPVGFWRDKSGNGRHAKQTTNNNRPQVQIADMNGRPGLNFDGSNDHYICDSGASFAAAYATAVVRRTGSPANWAAIYFHRSANSAAGFTNSAQDFSFGQTQDRIGSIHGLLVAGGVARRNGNALTTVNSGLFNVHDASLLPNTTDTNVIGIQGNITSTVGTQYPTIGVDPFSATRVYPMRLYELLVYSVIPTTAQLQAIERYLAQKWGITLA
jgi:hypothetical protein